MAHTSARDASPIRVHHLQVSVGQSECKMNTSPLSGWWNMNFDGILTEDEVKKVATQMITKRILAQFMHPEKMESANAGQLKLSKLLIGLVYGSG
ncbi:hypothetical protein D1007_60390 [Hordeum vulgare]|nr:hypothetical protein D1007_60390 [Hordeum vulgare]